MCFIKYSKQVESVYAIIPCFRFPLPAGKYLGANSDENGMRQQPLLYTAHKNFLMIIIVFYFPNFHCTAPLLNYLLSK